MAVSKLHREVRAWLDENLHPSWTVEGWPDAEVNLAKLRGVHGVAAFADFFITTTDGRCAVIEVHSELHGEKVHNAWNGGEEAHHRRLGNDDKKLQLCVKLGIPLYEVWPRDRKNLDERMCLIIEMINWAAEEPDITHAGEYVKTNRPLSGRADVHWKSQPLKSSGKTIQSNSSFGKGRTLGGSSFKRT